MCDSFLSPQMCNIFSRWTTVVTIKYNHWIYVPLFQISTSSDKWCKNLKITTTIIYSIINLYFFPFSCPEWVDRHINDGGVCSRSFRQLCWHKLQQTYLLKTDTNIVQTILQRYQLLCPFPFCDMLNIVD